MSPHDDKKTGHEIVNDTDVDIAYGALQAIDDQHARSLTDRSMLWKIDLRLMPLVWV